MPYASEAQRRWAHTDSARKAGFTKKNVKEYDEASEGMDLPERAKKKVHHSPTMTQIDCHKIYSMTPAKK